MPGKTGLGILIATIAVLLFGAMDVAAKWLIATYPVMQIIFMRNLLALPPLAACAMIWGGGRNGLRIVSWRSSLIRGIMISALQAVFFFSLIWIPLATAVALFFSGPLFITLLSGPVLKERVGFLRWLAVIVGFVGVLIICNPGSESFDIYALLPILAGLIYACVVIMIRLSPHEDSTAAVTFFGNFAAMIVCFFALPFGWEAIELKDFWVFIFIGCCGAFGALSLNAAYRYAPASILAPLDYLALPLAFAAGYFIWSEMLPGNFWLGSFLVVGAGVFITIREGRGARTAAS